MLEGREWKMGVTGLRRMVVVAVSGDSLLLLLLLLLPTPPRGFLRSEITMLPICHNDDD